MQTPAAQNPLRQGLFAGHASQFCAGVTHCPLLQTSPAAQFALDEQVVRQAPALHIYGAQFVVCEAEQEPAPLHVDIPCNVVAFEQNAAAQTVPACALTTPQTPLMQAAC